MKVFRTRLFSVFTLAALLSVAVFSGVYAGTTGKISGVVIDKKSGQGLPGVNVIVVGTNLGAVTDPDGRYYILQVPPGSYSVRASLIGYSPVVQTNVRVLIDLTSTVDFSGNFAMQEEAVQAGEVVVVAERPLVQPDISGNVANISAVEIQNLPRTSVQQIIDLQAGVEKGFVIRGGGRDQINFAVDGLSLRDGRDNQAFNSISYTAIDEIQVQTGGFNAEYGNVRAGQVSVVTKEGLRNKYTFDAIARYSRPDLRFGPGPKDPNAYFMRPFVDPLISDTGTDNGKWDIYTQKQYYPFAGGWGKLSDDLSKDTDPTNNLSVAQLKEVFAWHHRKDLTIDDSNYEIDATLGGPIPLLSKPLGGLRFSASYRGIQEPYFYPQARSSFKEDLLQGKITADIKSNMKLNLQGLWSKQTGMADFAFEIVNFPNPMRGGTPLYPWTDVEPGRFTILNGDDGNGGHVARSVIFGNDSHSINDTKRYLLGGSFTHTLNKNTFYEVHVSRFHTSYDSHPSRRRSLAVVKTVGPGYTLNEAPFGWTSQGENSIGSGLRLGGHWARARDTSRVSVWDAKIDFTRQLNRVQQLKAGIELIFNDLNMNFRSDDSVIVHLNRSRQKWEQNPVQGAAYVQNKLEFKGMIANVGLRLDHFDPRGEWFVYSAFDRAFTAKSNATRDEQLQTTSTKKQTVLSPRLGVSFPMTVNSKLYFNYGHFRQVLDARNLFQFQLGWNGDVYRLGDPNQPLQRTVAYELGYEQNLFDKYLLRLSGFYRDTDDQTRAVTFTSIDRLVSYRLSEPLNYSDVRGFEITLNKSRGRWLRGFVNYTFQQFKSGNFGLGQQNESVVAQRDYELTSTDHYQFRPVSQPFGTLNLEFVIPKDFGPKLAQDFRFDLLGGWRAGQHYTWVGPGGGTIPGLQNNVQVKDFWSLDLRISKNFSTTLGQAQFFFDVNNILNLKYMYYLPGNPYGGPFEGDRDYEDYMTSLQLPESTFPKDIVTSPQYINISGKDRPGDRRKDGVAFVPIEKVASEANLPANGFPAGATFLEPGRRVLFYVQATKRYMEFSGGTWRQADQGFVDQVLNDKAYIDMPNETYRTFLNPRSVLFGMRISF
jgi:outer membrane receptor protein involved in Fe transport